MWTTTLFDPNEYQMEMFVCLDISFGSNMLNAEKSHLKKETEWEICWNIGIILLGYLFILYTLLCMIIV